MEEAHWLKYLIPLPHEISIEGSICLRPEDVSVQVRDGAGEVERQAAAELVQLFVDGAGVKPEGRGLTVVIGVSDGEKVDVGRLEALPNSEQAYVIRTEGQQLFVTGLGERGVYYGVRTLCQLLRPVLSAEQVRVPLAQVVDWPDLEERGLWNFPDPPDWTPWLAEVKLNYGKMASTQLQPVERDKPNHAQIDGETYRAARYRGFNYVPYILHLNFLHDIGLFRAYPALAGKGDGALTGRYLAHKQGNQHRVPCASNPLLTSILCEWMESIALQGADEISCWLSERPGQCGCNACTAVGQFVLEARAFVRAWEAARQKYLDLMIRIFLSTTTCERDHRVLAELPPDVKVERCCATELERVTHHSRAT